MSGASSGADHRHDPVGEAIGRVAEAQPEGPAGRPLGRQRGPPVAPRPPGRGRPRPSDPRRWRGCTRAPAGERSTSVAEARPARERLEAERAGPGEEVEHVQPVDRARGSRRAPRARGRPSAASRAPAARRSGAPGGCRRRSSCVEEPRQGVEALRARPSRSRTCSGRSRCGSARQAPAGDVAGLGELPAVAREAARSAGPSGRPGAGRGCCPRRGSRGRARRGGSRRCVWVSASRRRAPSSVTRLGEEQAEPRVLARGRRGRAAGAAGPGRSGRRPRSGSSWRWRRRCRPPRPWWPRGGRCAPRRSRASPRASRRCAGRRATSPTRERGEGPGAQPLAPRWSPRAPRPPPPPRPAGR